MSKKRKPLVTNPLTQWLLDFVDEHDTNLTELSLEAGLSSGSLRSLVIHPERKPAVETCIRLAQVTDKSAEEIALLAGLVGITPTEELHPDRINLIRAYDALPASKKKALLKVADALLDEEE